MLQRGALQAAIIASRDSRCGLQAGWRAERAAKPRCEDAAEVEQVSAIAETQPGKG